MTAYQEKKRDFRHGCVFQGFAAPALFAAGSNFLAPLDAKAFNESAKRQTTPSPGGRFTGESVIRIRKVLEKKR